MPQFYCRLCIDYRCRYGRRFVRCQLVTQVCWSFTGTKWSIISIRSYFTVKKRDVLEGELEKVNCSCFHVKAELQRIAGVKRTTDGEGGSTEKIGRLRQITPKNKAKIGKYTAENGIAGRLK